MPIDRPNWTGLREDNDARMEQFWKVPLSPECIEFVESSESDAFSRFLLALEEATMVAMDAEWKPISDKSSGTPRVSILQIACRLQSKPGPREELASCRVKDEKSSFMSSQRKLELEELVDHISDSEDEAVGRSGSESDSEGDDSRRREEMQEKPVNTREKLLATIQLGGTLNLDKEQSKAAENLLPASDRSKTKELTESILKSGEPRREDSRLSGRQDEANDGNQGTDLLVDSRFCKRDEESVKVRRASLDAQTAAGKGSKTWYELVFLLDLFALPVSTFSKPLKDVFVDPTVLKLGFGFKQDLMNLRATFPGPESHGCFDKLEPYLDVGKMYRHLHGNQLFFSRGKRIVVGGDGLASIVESVLGLPLRKDMQCSNWEQRPLTSEQFDYAAADAYCLLAIFDALQVEASKSWFSPTMSGDAEDVMWPGSRVGVAGLLSPRDAESAVQKYTIIRICQPKRGDATVMVEAALGQTVFSGLRRDREDADTSECHLAESKVLGVDTLVRRFGEKLLMSGMQSKPSKRVRRKTRSRRAREAGKSLEFQDEVEIQYIGPPPWSTSVGGDGIPRFLCDAMVEGLARQLRCVGVDAASPNSRKCEPRELVDLAEREGRVILTRDAKLLRRRLVPPDLAYRVKRQGKWDQLAEIIETFNLLISEDQLLSRCTKCNGDFIPRALTAKEAARQGPWNQVIPACALENVDEFWQCADCKHLYWQGTQFTRAYKQFAAVCSREPTVGAVNKP